MHTHEIPQNEARHIFVQRTGASYIAAEAYLPKAYDTCVKCDEGTAHTHPLKSLMSEDDIATAVAEYGYDAYCESVDA